MDADVIHAMDHRSDLIAAALDRRLGVPGVASFFGWTNFSETSLRGRLYPVIDRFLMRRLRRIIVDSRFIGRSTKLPDGRVAVVPNGVDLQRFDPDRVAGGLKTRWFGTEGVTVVGLIGRVHPNKGHLDLARAAARLCPDFPDLRFVTLGAVPPGFESYRDEVAAFVAANGLQDRFVMTNVDSLEIPDAIASFDIATLPSRMESLAYVMLESMAMRRPVISARVGGHAEVIDDGETGYLIEPGDVDALSERIARLAGDPRLRESIAKEGRSRIEARYSTAAMVANTRAVYEDVLDKYHS
jgi:glycosyltransferase involved in cell wall biosynthesis